MAEIIQELAGLGPGREDPLATKVSELVPSTQDQMYLDSLEPLVV